MSFHSLYRHGFARVAACTTRTTLADPATNAQAILAMARDCDRQAVAVAVFPELGLSSYAISDLLQQTTLLNAVEAAAKNGKARELHDQLVELANAQNAAKDGSTSIPATFMRVTVAL